ncbi:two-component sensor histidine kinase [Psychrobacter sp. NG254]|uniref:sensor histidine kinase n=1 Tax=Psychrobacter sp. NG254 TaxID=2782003 RepID=UPI0018882DD6|nr:ATP-binding protein [Psychrobacter sp. NG254]MBF2718764.1 two-component sensor histidine kinase [Psychrobacter sp. NG254]
MKASEQPLKKSPKFTVRITLFWRLFLSLLLTILITSVLSIVVERWLAEKELTSRMDVQIDSLLMKREEMVAALRIGDVEFVRQMYRQDRQLMNQIRVFDEQGAIIFPRYRDKDGRQGQLQNGRQTMDRAIQPLQQIPSRPPRVENNAYGVEGRNADDRLREHDNEIPKIESSFWQKFLKPRTASSAAVADIDTRPELADISVELPDGQSIIIQLRPHLRFSDVVEIQHGNFPIRLLLIVIFSVLVCIWLSRTLTQRIGRVQNTVHRMIDGNYQANPELSKMGDDELGLLAKDVAHLSTRLVDSELARKQMLSDISHELRSPLARLDVATELTRDFAPNANRYLDRIDKESTRMNELIEQIIHIQSLQMQQYTVDNLESEAVDISDIISSIGEDVCFEFQHKDVHWKWQPPEASALDDLEGFWTVQGNAEQLYSALENVIRNAFMHTAAGSTVIAQIKAIQMDNKAPAVQIAITDEGGGVADKDLERIFHPFVRLDSARHRDTGGYGLGLAIVHAVVMAHKGYINAHNRLDDVQGLVVEIVLPTK